MVWQNGLRTCYSRVKPTDSNVNPLTRARLRSASAWLAVVLVAWPLRVSPQGEDTAPAFRQIDSMEARVQGCVTCHGQSGQGTRNGYFPRIAGKPTSYLYNQLIAFRDGSRKYPPMNYLLAYLPDVYLREMAKHFAKLHPPFATQERTRRRSCRTRARPGAGHGRRSQGTDPRLRHVSRRWLDRDGARHSGSGGAAPYVRRRAADSMEGGRSARRRTGLHETHCRAAVRRRHHGRRRVARAADAPKNPAPESSNLVRMPLACGSQR